MHVSKHKTPLRPCFVERCPHCKRIGEFWLVRHFGSVGPFSGTGYGIACGACGFEKMITKPEAKRFQQLAENYKRLLEGLISLEAFERVMEAAQFEVIRQIRKEAKFWLCEGCKEENPMTFSECWSCGRPANNLPPETIGEQKLPDVGGGYAWEQ